MIVGEYEQRAVCKRYNSVGNGPDSILDINNFRQTLHEINNLFQELLYINM